MLYDLPIHYHLLRVVISCERTDNDELLFITEEKTLNFWKPKHWKTLAYYLNCKAQFLCFNSQITVTIQSILYSLQHHSLFFQLSFCMIMSKNPCDTDIQMWNAFPESCNSILSCKANFKQIMLYNKCKGIKFKDDFPKSPVGTLRCIGSCSRLVIRGAWVRIPPMRMHCPMTRHFVHNVLSRHRFGIWVPGRNLFLQVS